MTEHLSTCRLYEVTVSSGNALKLRAGYRHTSVLYFAHLPTREHVLDALALNPPPPFMEIEAAIRAITSWPEADLEHPSLGFIGFSDHDVRITRLEVLDMRLG